MTIRVVGFRATQVHHGDVLRQIPSCYNIYRGYDNKFMGKGYRHPVSGKVWLNIKVNETTYVKFQGREFSSFKTMLTSLKDWDSHHDNGQQLQIPGISESGA